MRWLLATALAGSVLGLVPPGTSQVRGRRASHVAVVPQMSLSGTVLPVSYKLCASALAVRALNTQPLMEKAILGAATALSVLEFGPRATASFASAKAACGFSIPPPALALRWRLAVRVMAVATSSTSRVHSTKHSCSCLKEFKIW